MNRKKRETPPDPAKIIGDVEARIIALACGTPPEGYSKWALRLLADKTVEQGYVEDISCYGFKHSKKNEFMPNLKKCCCIPSKQNATFVAAMVDVLIVYSRSYIEEQPGVCMDEKPIQFYAAF